MDNTGALAAAVGASSVIFGGAALMFASRGRVASMTRTIFQEEFRQMRRQVATEFERSESRLASRLDAQERQLGASVGQRLGRLNERLAEVNAATVSLQSLQRQVADLEKVLSGPKTRGIFGEFQLARLVEDVLPSSSYTMQAPLRGGKVRVDCLIKVGKDAIPCDSKFPLDAYRDLAAAGTSGVLSTANFPGEPVKVRQSRDAQIVQARDRLNKSMKEHIKTISEKYIVPNETSDFALCFLPSEAVFAELIEHHDEILVSAHKHRVFIVSPMTFHATLTCFRSAIKDSKIREKTSLVFNELELLKADLERLKKRSDLVERDYARSRENLRLMNVSAEKAYRRGSKLCNQENDWLEDLKEEEEAQGSMPAILPDASDVAISSPQKGSSYANTAL